MLEKLFPTKKSQTIFIVIFYIVITGFFGGFLKISSETFTLFVYIFTGLFIGYGVFFETERIENFLINNITKISFILIIGFFLLPAGFVEINKEIFYIIGAIFAFWYGYKKYERDKELELIEKYTKKYDECGKYESGDIFYYKRLLGVWYEEYFLKERGYISNELWSDWQRMISDDIYKILIEENLVSEDNGISKGGYIKNGTFIGEIILSYCENSNGFCDFLLSKIIELKKIEENFLENFTEKKDTKMIEDTEKNINTYKLIIDNINYEKNKLHYKFKQTCSQK